MVQILTVVEKISNILMKYLLFVGVPTYIARRIEVKFWKNLDQKALNRLNKDKELIDKLAQLKIEEPTITALGKRGGVLEPTI